MQVGNTEQFSNHHLSSDWSLQPETMKPESLVIVDQHATVNLYLSLVHTARHTMKVNRIQRNCSFFFIYITFPFIDEMSYLKDVFTILFMIVVKS